MQSDTMLLRVTTDMTETNQGDTVVLVIDDEEAVREAVTDILVFEGIQVITAVDGYQGIDLFKNQHTHIDLVLLDLSMPGINGADTYKALREINPDVKIILSSGFDEAEATKHFVGQGLAGFLQKPYKMKNLVIKIKEYLNSNPED